MIPFNSVPNSLRVPFVAAEFGISPLGAGSPDLPYRALLLGQKLAAGSAAANSLVPIFDADQAVALAGRGSQFHRMAKAWFKVNGFTELWLGVLLDDPGATAGTKTITVSGPATAAGTLALYIAGTAVPVTVGSSDSANTIATNIAAAINLLTDLPYMAAAVNPVVTLTHRNKGATTNDVDVRANYNDGDVYPTGVSVAVATGVTGATNPTLTSLIAAMGDTWFHVIAHPYTDATSLTAIETEMASRFGPMRMIDGVAFSAAAGTQGTLATLGNGRNSPSSCIVAQPGRNPLQPMGEFAATVAGLVALAAADDPARPFQTLQATGTPAPAEFDLFTIAERNLNLFDGISTSRVNAGGVVELDRLITTYKTNAAGSPDTSYLDVTTMLTLMYLRYSWRARVAAKWPRHKLADDGTKFAPGQPVVTPKVAKSEAVCWFNDMEERGLVEDSDTFKANLVVERNANDPNRLDILLPPNLINQLIVSATSIQFSL